MTDQSKIVSSEDGRNRPASWEEKRRIAAGFLGPTRIAERRRRRDQGEPLLQIVDEDQETVPGEEAA